LVGGRLGTGGDLRFKSAIMLLESESSDRRSSPDMRDLKMSHVDNGASRSNCGGSSLLACASEASPRVVILHAGGAMKSDGLHSRSKRSQLLHTGFFSSQRLCLVLHV
jgi:hypothetical protein